MFHWRCERTIYKQNERIFIVQSSIRVVKTERGWLHKARFIANSSSCTTTILSKLLTSCLTALLPYCCQKHWIRYCDTVYHYENTPIQIYWKFYHKKKTRKFSDKNSDIFHISAQNIDCEYSLEPPRWGVSNEYPQSMFWAVIRKIMFTL